MICVSDTEDLHIARLHIELKKPDFLKKFLFTRAINSVDKMLMNGMHTPPGSTTGMYKAFFSFVFVWFMSAVGRTFYMAFIFGKRTM